MSSTGTPTTNLGLNQWLPNDKPERVDFNRDNQKIEAAMDNKVTKGPPTEYDLLLASGLQYLTNTKNKYSKSQEQLVVIYFQVSKTDGTVFSTGIHTIANLPTGFRPGGGNPAFVVTGHTATTGLFVGTSMHAYVSVGGAVNVHIPVSDLMSIGGSVAFYAE